MGSALVQLGKLRGAKVIGVVGSSHKVEHVQRLGADFVIGKSFCFFFVIAAILLFTVFDVNTISGWLRRQDQRKSLGASAEIRSARM